MFYFKKNLYISDTSERRLQNVYQCLNSRKFLLKNNIDAHLNIFKVLQLVQDGSDYPENTSLCNVYVGKHKC